MSLQSLLSIARSALLTHQRAMDVTGHNVANANTPGYSRQRLVLGAEMPLNGPVFPVGRGVTAYAIDRARDGFWDASFREDSGHQGHARTLMDVLGRVESAIGEPSDSGIAATLDGLFKSFSDLASQPASGPNRDLVKQSASRLVSQLRGLDGQLGRVAQDAAESLRAQVAEVNQLTSQIAELNGRILETSGAGGVAPDLQDQRDRLVDRLSQFTAVRVLPRADGSIGVVAGDTLLVDGSLTQTLAVTAATGGGFQVSTGAGAANLAPGSLTALVETTRTTIPGLQRQLDDLARTLVTEVNALHRTGYTLSGATNQDFFDPAGVTARSIALSAGVTASTDAIAAAVTNAPGDGALASRLAALSSAAMAGLGGRTFREHVVSLAGTVGNAVRTAAADFDAYDVLVRRSDQQRTAVSGVSVDEEMITLIGQQQAYQAAARLVSIADEMMQEILRIL